MRTWFNIAFVALALISGKVAALARDKDRPKQRDEYDGPTVNNCGFNCVVTICELFGASIVSESVAQSLDLDGKLSDYVSLQQIAESLESKGFHCRAYRDVDVQGILELLKDGKPGILHVNSGGAGHFIVLNREAKDGLTLYDYPDRRELTSELLTQYLKDKVSGYYLSVSKDDYALGGALLPKPSGAAPPEVKESATVEIQAKVAVEPEFQTGKNIRLPRKVSRSAVSRLAEQVIVPIAVENRSANEIAVTTIKGACSCFVKYEGAAVIGAGKTETYLAYFNAEKMPLLGGGMRQTSVIIATSDPALPLAQVIVEAEVNPREKSILCSPRICEMGIFQGAKKDSGASVVSREVEIIVPLNGNSGATVELSAFSKERLTIRHIQTREKHIFGERFLSFDYSIGVKSGVFGQLDEKIVFKTDQKVDSEFSIKVTGFSLNAP
jgi:hypothetical protein